MAHPKSDHPTRGELEVLKILWDRGPSTIREIWELLNAERKRHRMSVKDLLDVMFDKGWVARRTVGRAFVYRAKISRDKTFAKILNGLLGRVFDADALVAHLLDQAKPSREEIEAIRKTVEEYHKKQGKK